MKNQDKNKRDYKIVASLDYLPNKSNKLIHKWIANQWNSLKEYENPNPFNLDDIHKVLEWLVNEIIPDGLANNYIPVIVGIDMFNYTRAILYELNHLLEITIIAQNESNFYCCELGNEENKLLKFWDINNLADEDELFEETGEAVHIFSIPKYLKQFLIIHDYVQESELAVRVLTKSSITRQFARKKVGNLKYKNAKNKQVTLHFANHKTALQNQPYSYMNYCLRKSCFTGGFSFISNLYAGKIMNNVVEIDVNSMHHAMLAGHYMSVDFRESNPQAIVNAMQVICEADDDWVMENYYYPFHTAFNCCVKFKNIMIKENSVFHKNWIGLLSREKFVNHYESDVKNFAKLKNEEEIKNYGFNWNVINGFFSFNKLNCADEILIYCNEIEFWNISQVYDWDSLEVLYGEISTNMKRPTDFVTMQSQILYAQKNQVKQIYENYRVGKPYKEEIPSFLPKHIKDGLIKGNLKKSNLEKFYNLNIKTKFNTIYGNQAQDVYNPKYRFSESAKIVLDRQTIMNEDNFEEKLKDKKKSLQSNYNYGTRISTFSRMHLIMAMKLLYKADSEIKIISGDTDSIKFISSKKDILKSLNPLHNAIDKSKKIVLERCRRCFRRKYNPLEKVGHFEYVTTYKKRIDYANKQYVTQKYKNIKMTIAGLPTETLQPIMQEFVNKYGFDLIFTECFGYNTEIAPDISQLKYYNLPDKIYKWGRPTLKEYFEITYKMLDTNKQEIQENVDVFNLLHTETIDCIKFIFKYNDNYIINYADRNGELQQVWI